VHLLLKQTTKVQNKVPKKSPKVQQKVQKSQSLMDNSSGTKKAMEELTNNVSHSRWTPVVTATAFRQRRRQSSRGEGKKKSKRSVEENNKEEVEEKCRREQ
jgi:hypothetical protein